jgi:hypothetical protein
MRARARLGRCVCAACAYAPACSARRRGRCVRRRARAHTHAKVPIGSMTRFAAPVLSRCAPWACSMGVALGVAPAGVAAAAAAPARPRCRAAAGAAAPSPACLGAGSPRCAAARLPAAQRARRGARCAAGPTAGAAAAAAESPAAAAGARMRTHPLRTLPPHAERTCLPSATRCPLTCPPRTHAATRCAEFAAFSAAAGSATLIPLYKRIFSDHLTPVLAYRCLVKQDDREAPSFLLESVVNGNTSVRGARGVCACVRKGCESAGDVRSPKRNPSVRACRVFLRRRRGATATWARSRRWRWWPRRGT